jgi:putative ABC transport system permease protein
MSALRQIVAVSAVGLRSLPERRSTAAVIVFGLVCVVGVLTSMLSLTAGLRRAYLNSEDESRAMVFARNALGEWSRSLQRSSVATILDAPGIAKGADGAPLADAEFLLRLPPIAGFADGSLELRGFGSAGRALRPAFRIVSGRLFRPGTEELVAGAGAAKRFGLVVGSRVRLPDGEWPVVGIFTCGGEILESHLVADAATVMAATRRNGFGAVIAQLVNPQAYAAFAAWLTRNPTLSVSVERKSDYDLRLLGPNTAFFTRMAYVIGAIMALGALFGVVKIMYAAVRARTREIGTLRAMGFGGAAVATSVLAEAALLGILGALLGTTLAWCLFDGREMWVWGSFRLQVSMRLWGLGITWALVTALAGGLLPAIRAAHLPASEALRTS